MKAAALLIAVLTAPLHAQERKPMPIPLTDPFKQIAEQFTPPRLSNKNDVTRVEIEGVDPLKRNQILAAIGGRFELVRSQPAAPSRADDAAFMLSNLLRREGYAHATVDWRIVSAKHIVLSVNEGSRSSLRRVTLLGVDSDVATRLSKLYASVAARDRPFGLGPPPYREEDADESLGLIRQDLQADGYWEADVQQDPPSFDHTQVDITVRVRLGPRHVIGSPTITGDARMAPLVREASSKFSGRPATTKHINALRLALVAKVSAQGYARAEILMGWHIANGIFHPDISITTGERVKLRHLTLQGLEKTNPDRVLVRLHDLQDDWYDEKAAHQRINLMLATGAFSSARIDTTDAGSNLIDATLHLQEGKAREVTVALGGDSYYGPVGRVTYTDRNWLGELYGLSTGFEASARGLFGDIKISDPWIHGSDVSGHLRGSALLFDRDGYLKYETGIEAGIDWKPTDHYKLELRATLSGAKVEADGLPDSEIGMSLYAQPRIRLTQKIDHRETRVLPKQGWHIEAPTELGSATGTEIVPYLSQELSGGWYHPLGRRWHIGLGGEVGVLFPLGDSADFPIDMRYFNGGPRSVRSFPERELGPSANGYPVGGESIWNTSIELSRILTGSLHAVGFLDTGGLGRNTSDLFTSDVEVAAGLGLRFDLPIGPARLEYGYNLTRNTDEPAGTLHFAIGTAF
jgi:outer membrane protein insertion porin family